MLIITNHSGLPYGLLGPQIVATYITHILKIPTKVLGIKRGFKKEKLLKLIESEYEGEEKIILFSYHSGRKDIIELARELKTYGYRLVLGGPQVVRDFWGEPKRSVFSHRISGLGDIFDLCYFGPVDYLSLDILTMEEGLRVFPWGNKIYTECDWENLFCFGETLEKIYPKETQVLRSIGCPYSLSKKIITLDPPSFLKEVGNYQIEVGGCSFCDIAWDKGFCGNLKDEDVLAQIKRIPEIYGRKVTFELIDEYPINFLPRLIEILEKEDLRISQINLVLRVDDILKRRSELEKALREFERRGERLLLSSIGFESFSGRILKNLNKGVSVSENLEAVKVLRELKRRFPETFLYRKDEGGTHGFIHPTPWDGRDTESETLSAIGAYGLFLDILPEKSTPLIIHHGSPLADWIRSIEENFGIRFKRGVNEIWWWDWKRT